ncbi:S9 family peptidase [Sphingomonas sp.]|jgi:dipeptidyl aminopeptidase/acylaminoacyl peptidase|uniref:S9 family peptidase n=1 Tax=Sphingomonas sp. TaxID=28214 RepID=UPI002DE30489|nr:S9 family peptidase [Sphingomonas sp.]
MRRPLIALAFCLAAPLHAQPADGPSRTLQGGDLFSLEVATDPQISPDGSIIAYVRRSGDIMTDRARPTIWQIDTRTGAHSPLIAGPGSHTSPRWSPDGRRLAYVSTAEGGAPQLFVRWMATAQTARVTGLPTSPGQIVWSPDGTRLAYTMLVPAEAPALGKPLKKPEGAEWAKPLEIYDRVVYRTDSQGYLKPGLTQIFTVSAEGGAPRQVTFAKAPIGGQIDWTSDGRKLLFSANLTDKWQLEGNDSELQEVDVETGAIRALTDRRGPDQDPVTSPDGKWIAFTGYDDAGRAYEADELYVMPAGGGAPRALTPRLDRSVSSPVWSADSRAIYVSYDDKGVTKVARVGMDGSMRTVAEGLTGSALDRPYTGGEFSVARDGSVAATVGNPQRPSDIALVRGGTTRTLTRLNQELFAGKTLGAVQKVNVTAFDGKPIDAWLTLPPTPAAGGKHPLVLEIHGGPHSAYGPSFATDNQLYASAGYAVLSVNPRGSTSYGEAFANEIDKTYPARDYDDLMSAVDAAIATGQIDPNNLFVTGGSGGGVLTSWIIGKTDRFKAAATQKPVIDWASFALTADNPAFFTKYWFGKKPWEDPQLYWSRSPLSLVGNVKTPTLVVVGSEDYRTPVSEAEQYYSALQLQGVPTMLVKVPGASHGGLAVRPSQSAAKAAAIIAWFDRYRAK